MNVQIANNLNLTDNEITALKTCLNYDNLQEQLADNFTNGDRDEFMAALNWNRHQVDGLIGSLEKKGLGMYDEDDDLFWLTEHGVYTIFAVIDQEQQAA